jgi:transposase-like protein
LLGGEPTWVKLSGRAFWEPLVDEVKSGATIADVARRHRVQPRTLSWWKWRLRSIAAPRFLAVVPATPPAPPAPEELDLRVGDVAIRVGVGTDVEYVAALVRALRA